MLISSYFVNDQLMGIYNMNLASVSSTGIIKHERKRERKRISCREATHIHGGLLGRRCKYHIFVQRDVPF